MTRRFKLFDSHLDFAHQLCRDLVSKGDTVIDATCGNGHDTLILAKLALDEEKGSLLAIDLQEEAIHHSQERLRTEISAALYNRIHWQQGSHAIFPTDFREVSLIVYNLGYLPGGDKSQTTQTETTLSSVQQALLLLKEGGAIIITCYPGHAEGEKEEKALLDYLKTLPPDQWSISHHQWINRKKSPSLIFLQKEK